MPADDNKRMKKNPACIEELNYIQYYRFPTNFLFLNPHLNQNTQRRHACAFCGKAFARRRDLDNHERIHTGARPFQCQICERRFNVKTYCQL